MLVPRVSLQYRARLGNEVGLAYQSPPPEYLRRPIFIVWAGEGGERERRKKKEIRVAKEEGKREDLRLKSRVMGTWFFIICKIASFVAITGGVCGKSPNILKFAPTIGEMPEWSIGAVSKTVVPLRAPGVRIPLSPPKLAERNAKQAFLFSGVRKLAC